MGGKDKRQNQSTAGGVRDLSPPWRNAAAQHIRSYLACLGPVLCTCPCQHKTEVASKLLCSWCLNLGGLDILSIPPPTRTPLLSKTQSEGLTQTVTA